MKWKIPISDRMSPASICSKIFRTGNAQLIPQVPACWKQILSIIRRNQWFHDKDHSYSEKWKTIPRYPGFLGWSLSSSISRMVSKLVRHFDQDERQTEEPYIWDAIKSELEKGFKDQGAEKFSESQWLDHV